MRFRRRLILSYSLLVTGLIAILAVVFEFYNIKHLETLSLQNMDILSKNMSHQLDEIVRPMVFITEFLLSDNKTLSAITTITRTERNSANSIFMAQAKKDIRSSFSTYCNDVNFYRVVFFSEAGDILSNNLMVYTIPDGEADLSKAPFTALADKAMGKPVLIPIYNDPWDTKNPIRVFSIIRFIMGNNISSYMEIQKPAKALEDIYDLNNTGSYLLAVINGRGDIFYSQLDETENRQLRELREKLSPEKSLTNFAGHYAASYYSPYTDTYTVVIQAGASMASAVRDTTVVNVIMALFLCATSMALVSFLSLRITAPIGRLIERIENTSLENIENSLDPSAHYREVYRDDELARLWESYNGLLKRLNIASRQEKQMGILHMQAEFDALQAQMNPHFLYNVLNVISHRGVQNGDEVICEICEKLASMLRYSAGVSQRLVPIREEIEYLNHYLFLLKIRYHDKLNYSMDIADDVLDQMIPKVVLQQLVENSITHGFTESSGVMSIRVRGFVENGSWIVEIVDNGCGFKENEKTGIEKKMAKIVDLISQGKLTLEIGGMGLLNIYARFLILFGNGAIFRIANTETGGACVTVGAAMKDAYMKGVSG